MVATATTALDRFSKGRLTLGVGLGGVRRAFEAFGEPGDATIRAAMLDEALTVIGGLWSGQRLHHRGRFFDADDVALSPVPLQQPRPPVWVGGSSTGALRRAAAWDGYTVGNVADEHGRPLLEAGQLRQRLDLVGRTDDAFDVAVVGVSEPGDDNLRHEFARAAATWWLECIHDLRGPLDTMLRRVGEGP